MYELTYVDATGHEHSVSCDSVGEVEEAAVLAASDGFTDIHILDASGAPIPW